MSSTSDTRNILVTGATTSFVITQEKDIAFLDPKDTLKPLRHPHGWYRQFDKHSVFKRR